jgi:hypothetical protein
MERSLSSPFHTQNEALANVGTGLARNRDVLLHLNHDDTTFG